MAVGSLVLGIIGLVWALVIPALKVVAVITGLIGIILGALGRKDPERKGIATAGLVLSILAVVFGLIMFVACASAVGAGAAGCSALSDALNS